MVDDSYPPRNRKIVRIRYLHLWGAVVLAAVAAVSGALVPSPRDVCRGFKAEAERKTCYEKQYQSADYELNRVYRLIREKLPAPHRAEMKQSSLEWIRGKEYICGYRADLSSGKEGTKDSNYYSCLLDFTRSRTRFLRQAFGREGVARGTAGMYEDGVGGRLKLAKKTDDRFEFSLEVVRGPTAHIGEIHGAFTLHGRKGVYRSEEYCEEEKDGGTDQCCNLTFAFQKYHLKVTEKNCSYYRGARAYFDGAYRKVRRAGVPALSR